MQVYGDVKQEGDFMNTLFKTAVIALILLGGCRDRTGDFVPNILVDVTLNLNQPTYQPINVVGGMIYFNEAGYRGLLIYRYSVDEFRAYDRACTYLPSEPCHVVGLDS